MRAEAVSVGSVMQGDGVMATSGVDGEVRFVAHRGDPIACVENTLPAFERAVADGVTAIELDVRLTRDGTVVVLHDDTTARLFGHDEPVASQSWDEVGRLAAHDGSTIPTLAGVLDALGDRATFVIDMADAALALPACAVVAASGKQVAWTGHTDALREVARMRPDDEIYLTLGDSGALPSPDALRDIRPTWLHPYVGDVTPQLAEAARRLGAGLSCWTVDSLADAQRVVDMGVRRITSNRAAELARHFAS